MTYTNDRLKRVEALLRLWARWRLGTGARNYATINSLTGGPAAKSVFGRIIRDQVEGAVAVDQFEFDEELMRSVDRAHEATPPSDRLILTIEYLLCPGRTQEYKAREINMSQARYSERLNRAHVAMLRSIDLMRIFLP